MNLWQLIYASAKYLPNYCSEVPNLLFSSTLLARYLKCISNSYYQINALGRIQQIGVIIIIFETLFPMCGIQQSGLLTHFHLGHGEAVCSSCLKKYF